MEGTQNHQQKSELQLKDVTIPMLNTVRARQVEWECETDNESQALREWKQHERERERERETDGLNLNTWHSGSCQCCSCHLLLFFSISLSLSDAGGLWKGSTECYSFLGKETLETAPFKAANPDMIRAADVLQQTHATGARQSTAWWVLSFAFPASQKPKQ